MTYTDYIKSYNDRIEREKQLVARYSQPKCVHANRFLWAATSVEKKRAHNITNNDVFKAIVGIILAGAFIIASILI